MCGITGAVSLSDDKLDVSRFKPMVDVIAHRGPDDAGYLAWQSGRHHWSGSSFGQAFTDTGFDQISPLLPRIDTHGGRSRLESESWDVFLGHRRLSIIDLSPAGHQPMSDIGGRVWITYNGEVYNYRELRAELEGLGHRFVSESDTEVLLYAYMAWGEDCVKRFNGMFALAIWDSRTRTLLLARDRYGIKPLYYRRCGPLMLFASEIKSLLQYQAVPGLDLLALNEYFSFQNTFTDRTLFDGVRLLEPGHILRVDLDGQSVSSTQYWDFDFTQVSTASVEDQEAELATLIEDAVARQCVSDVPIACYLSGGMDSGTVTALTAKAKGRICSFTAGFDLSEAASHEQSFDEREQAERMANLFQTEHYEVVLHSGDMEAVMEDLVWSLEDLRVGQCYPNFFVSRLASKFTKVVLAGTGGDELFGGYPWRYAAAIGPTQSDYIQNYYRYWQRLVSNKEKQSLFRPELQSALRGLDDRGAVPFEDHTLSAFRRVFNHEMTATTLAEQVNHSLYFECKTFLHGLLVVEDKLSMAHSLETRVPFLDNDLVDFACRVPVIHKVSGIEQLQRLDENLQHKPHLYAAKMDRGKNILRRAMMRLLPEAITGSRKQGFSAPDESWFRGSAEDYIRRVLLDPGAHINEYLDPVCVKEILDAHTSGASNRRLLIWSLLSFETWLGAFFGSGSTLSQ